jgi:Methyltransferase domain
MNNLSFENVGWKRVSYTEPDLDLVQAEITQRGLRVRSWDIAPLLEEFSDFLKLPEYAGSYRQYGGTDQCSFLEKALEHFLSFEIARPERGQTFMDIGSCVSVVPEILRRHYGCDCYAQDLALPVGVNGWNIGSNAAQIPLPDSSLDGMTLHCTFEHFEKDSDSRFIQECARLLKAGGKTIILPLYVNKYWTNITGDTDEASRSTIGFDSSANYWCVIPEWHNRFGRHYSGRALLDRVLEVGINCGLELQMRRVINFEKVHPGLWLKWVLVLQKP